MKCGLFAGSFDPIHLGHLSLAIEMSEIHQLDEVLLCPAACSPFKKDIPPVSSGKDRVKMVEESIEKVPRCSVTDIEFRMNEFNFTIDVIKEILKSSDRSLHLILAQDSLNGFDKWKSVEELIELAPPLIGCRDGDFEKVSTPLTDKFKKGFTKTRLMDISSTEIRQRLKKGLYCGHLIPSKALDYIMVHQLYLQP